MAEPIYGALPTIKRVDITAAGDVTFWFVGAACAQTSEDFPKDSPTGIWLRELEAQLTQDLLILHHGYGCELDGTQMTGPCKDCRNAQEGLLVDFWTRMGQMGTVGTDMATSHLHQVWQGAETIMKVFILEDDPERIRYLREQLIGHETAFVASCTEADKFQPPYDLILLDHDLGGRQMAEHEDCGLTFVNLIKELINPEAFVLIHSYNALGAERMQDALQGAGVENAIYGPFRGHVFNAVLDAAIERGRRALAAK